jgi:hypothetical protein
LLTAEEVKALAGLSAADSPTFAGMTLSGNLQANGEVRSLNGVYSNRLYMAGGVALLGNHSGHSLQHSPQGLYLYGSELVFAVQTPDTTLARNAVGQLDIRGNSGLRVRNFANTANAPIVASQFNSNNLTASNYNLGLGQNVSNVAFTATALGWSAAAPHTNSIAIGTSAATSQAGQLSIGSAQNVTQMRFGDGTANVSIVNPITASGTLQADGQILFGPSDTSFIDSTGTNLRLGVNNSARLTVDTSAITINDAGLLLRWGTTSAFPALKRNGTAINFRLADDSADAPITASQIQLSGFGVVPGNSTQGLRFGDGFAADIVRMLSRFTGIAGGIRQLRIAENAHLAWAANQGTSSTDVTLSRDATGPSLLARVNGGLLVRNFANDADAPISCGAITASGSVTVNGIPLIGGNTGATANAVLRADGVGGTTLKNSGVTIDDTGNVELNASSCLRLRSSTGFHGGGSRRVLEVLLSAPNETVVTASLGENGHLDARTILSQNTVTCGTHAGFKIGGGWGEFNSASTYGQRTFVSSVYNTEIQHGPSYVARIRNQNGSLGNLELGQITNVAQSASTVATIIRGAASQTANLTEWQDSVGTVVASMSLEFLTMPDNINRGIRFGTSVHAPRIGGLGSGRTIRYAVGNNASSIYYFDPNGLKNDSVNDGGEAWLLSGGANRNQIMTISGTLPTGDFASHSIRVRAGSAFANATTNITGGDIEILAGDGSANSAGNADGGDITLTAGTGHGTGRDGLILLQNLPTADPVVTGALWNDGGTLKISAG